MLVIRYDVVNQAALFAAPNSELIAAYVDAVMVMSNPDRKTLAHKAVQERSVCSFSYFNIDLSIEPSGYVPISIHQKPGPGSHISS